MVVATVAERRSGASGEQGGYTAYGWFILEAANRRRVRSQKRIAELITGAGYPITQPALSKVMTGRTEPSRRLNAAVAEALLMDEAERRDLADVFAYTDNTQVLSEENYQGMREIEEEAREDAERHRRGPRGWEDSAESKHGPENQDS